MWPQILRIAEIPDRGDKKEKKNNAYNLPLMEQHSTTSPE